MPWSPLEAWPNERRWIWLTIAGWLLVLRGPALMNNVQVEGGTVPDFFQEYASARNWFEGRPIYADLREATPRYLGVSLDQDHALVSVNGHPPTSVFLAFPLARLRFPDAFLVWNLVSLAALAASLWIVHRQLRIPFSAWSLGPLIALALLCYPLQEQCHLGQLTLILLLLLTGTWAAERSGRFWLAGALLGAATAVKLFPGFLLFYYLLRGRWKVVAAGLAMIAVLTGLTLSVFGVDAYRSYLFVVLPEIQWFRVGWENNSLWGFWSRLFDPAPEHIRDRSLTEPLFYSPTLATTLSLVSSAAIAGALAWSVRRDAGGQKSDLTFALAVVAMLLISPISWAHYLLLLLVPLGVVWTELSASRFERAIFLLVAATFWLGYPLVWTVLGIQGRTADWIDSLGVLSYEFYALLTFFGLVIFMLICAETRRESSPSASSVFAVGAVIMAGLWVHVLHVMWLRYGLFVFIGGDFGIYQSIARATLAEGPQAMYDMDLVALYERDLMAYYGPAAGGLNLGPCPYPAIYTLPFMALTVLSPPAGYLVWTLLNLGLACAVARGTSARSRLGCWGLAASCVLSFPVVMALALGQVTMVFLYGFYRAYEDLIDGRDFRAGLWCGTFYLKPQYLVFLILVFLMKWRWRALGGLFVTGLFVLVGSLAVVGPDGLRAHYQTLKEMSGFRDVPPMIGPWWMTNWRGLLACLLPESVADSTGRRLTIGLSLATVGLLLLVWRGPWAPQREHFPVAMLATVIIMMMASYHNHSHSVALLIVPGMAVAAQGGKRRLLSALLLGGLYGPPVLYFATAQMIIVCWLIIALMLAMLAVIIWGEVDAHLKSGRDEPLMSACGADSRGLP